MVGLFKKKNKAVKESREYKDLLKHEEDLATRIKINKFNPYILNELVGEALDLLKKRKNLVGLTIKEKTLDIPRLKALRYGLKKKILKK